MQNNSLFKQPEQIISRKLKSLMEIWLEICAVEAAARFAPCRDEITPVRLKALLPWTWMMDVVPDGDDFRFRFAGEEVVAFFGERHSGRLLSQVGAGEPFYDGMRRMLTGCTSLKKPLAVGPMRSTHASRHFLEFEALTLPLSENGKTVTGILGAIESWPLGTHTQDPTS